GMGYTMVVHLGHPLVGRTLPVVRGYGRREKRRWVVETPDGSRQGVPAAWCTPPAPSPGSLHTPADAGEGASPAGAAPSPLSLAALRDLAALVHRLKEARGSQEEEHSQDVADQSGGVVGRSESNARGRRDDRSAERRVAGVGKLPGGGTPN